MPKLISGESIGALALSGVEAGLDVASIDLMAEKHSEFYRLNGSTRLLTGRPDVDVLIVYAGVSMSSMAPALSAFIVEKVASEFHTRAKVNATALQGTPTSELIFDNFPVSAQNLLGEVGGGVQVSAYGPGRGAARGYGCLSFAWDAVSSENRRLLVVQWLFPEQDPQNSAIFQP
ncbi:MAG: acyl-CoA dehydrogenase family protein [Pseudomonadota bacterium]